MQVSRRLHPSETDLPTSDRPTLAMDPLRCTSGLPARSPRGDAHNPVIPTSAPHQLEPTSLVHAPADRGYVPQALCRSEKTRMERLNQESGAPASPVQQ